MLKQKPYLLFLTALGLMILLISGCGESVSDKTTTNGTTTGDNDKINDNTPYPNADLLVSADDLEALQAANDDNLIVMDIRSAAAYAAGHIPGAIHMAHAELADSGLNLKSVAELEALLGGKGVAANAKIVLYDDTIVSWGAAGRVFWALEYLGCKDVHLLNGGWDKWYADGRTTTTTPTSLAPAVFSATVNSDILIDKETIASRLGDDDFAVIDTRTDEEFNGWILYNEARAGHIKGAVQLPYEWSYNSDMTVVGYNTMKGLFEERGLTSDKQIVAYCTAGIRSGFAYFLARLMGYENAANYDESMWDWAAADADTYPMEKLQNYQALVYPAWVNALINNENPPTYPGDGYVVLFTSWEARCSEDRTDYVGTPYESGHIPGAIFMDTYAIENGPNSEYGDGYETPYEGNVKSIPELQELFGSMGITKDKTVVVYTDDEISMMTAGRVAWALLLAGVDDVRILNGSYDAWQAYGGAEETTPNPWVATDFGSSAGNPEYLATTEEVQAVVSGDDTSSLIVDDREWAEFVGSSNSYYQYFHEYGRIPTAQWIGDWTEISRGDMQSLKTYTEVADQWIGSGFTSDKKKIFYCGTGWRSGLYSFYAYLMGETAASYDGGWYEWSYEGNAREVGNSDKLMSAESLKSLIDSNNESQPYVIVETGWGPAGDGYTQGHVPSAIWVNTDEIEYDAFNARNDWPIDAGDPPIWDRSTTEEEDLAKGLTAADSLPRNWWNIYPDKYLLPGIAYMGIDKNTTVVVYGDDVSAAARVIWTLMYAGVEDVRLLNGGDKAWETAGYTLETGSNERTPCAYFDPDMPTRVTAIHPEYKVDIPYIRSVVNGETEDAAIVDIRSTDEYAGITAPYGYIPTSGRIPGAIWGKAGSGPWTMEDYVNDDGTMVAPDEIYTFWRSQGITSDKALSYYCGTGWRSSLAWFYGYMMGIPRNYNFDSGWFEWSMGAGSAYAGADPVLNPIVDENPTLP
ncbi:MAG: rhodanese-like domain-containing protein [Desulfuromonas sp.]|nr:rhodanese-like domain-containing protein [Desulfuromonas sp.]